MKVGMRKMWGITGIRRDERERGKTERKEKEEKWKRRRQISV